MSRPQQVHIQEYRIASPILYSSLRGCSVALPLSNLRIETVWKPSTITVELAGEEVGVPFRDLGVSSRGS